MRQLVAITALLLVAVTLGCSQTSPSPTAGPAPTSAPTATATPTPLPTQVPTSTLGVDPTPTLLPQATPTPGTTPTEVPTQALIQTLTPSPTATPRPTDTPAPTLAPTPTATPAPVPTSTPPPTSTPTPTPVPLASFAPATLPASVLAEHVPLLNARVADLRFFESTDQAVPASNRIYTNRFHNSTARYINWEVSLVYPNRAQTIPSALSAVYYRSDGTIYGEFEQSISLQADWIGSAHVGGWGQRAVGQWPAGSYRVVLSVAGVEIASGWFEVANDSVFALGSAPASSLLEGIQQVGSLLPWLTDANSLSESRALVALSDIALQDPDLAAEVAVLGWVQDGIDSREEGALEHLAILSARDPVLTATVARSPWARDGVIGLEWAALKQLVLISAHSAALAQSVLALPWIGDGIIELEKQALEYLAVFAREDVGAATAVTELPWLGDGINVDERLALWSVSNLIAQAVQLGIQATDFLWFADGITADERRTLGYLQDLTIHSAQLGKDTAAFLWVGDTITEPERSTLRNLRDLTLHSLAMGTTVAGYPWMRDNITTDERWTVRYLSDLANRDATLAEQLIAGPFLTTSFEERDRYALLSILELGDSPVDLALLTSADWFVDGVDHPEAALITVLYRQSLISSDEFRSLLEFYEYQSGSVSLPLAGEVQLSIIRPYPETAIKAQGQMQRLENAVRHVEGFFDVAFPQHDVILLYGETGTQTTGIYVGSHMVVDRPVVIQDDLRRVEAHEVSHYYWGSSAVPIWFREGGADFLASYVIAQVYGDSLRSRFTDVGGRNAAYCNSLGMDTIQDLQDNLAIIGFDEFFGRPYYGCNYVLGEALFLELYDIIGPGAFQDVWKSIYLAVESLGQEYSDAEIYQLYSDVTPGGVVGDFNRTYSTWHGGSFIG